MLVLMEVLVELTTCVFAKMDIMALRVPYVIFTCIFLLVFFLNFRSLVVGCNDNRGCLTCLNGGACNINGYCSCKPGFADKICSTCSLIFKIKYFFNLSFFFFTDIGLDYILNTVILTQNEVSSVYSMTGVKNTVLLYRASRDGFTNVAFHAKCDGRAKTITIIKTRDNYVFGGYTGASWDSTSGYKYDTSAYIFSLRRNGVSGLSRYSVGSGYYSYAIYASAAFGPTFGGGHNLYIRDRSDVYTGSYTYHSSYYSGIPSSTYLAGTYNTWLTNDIEVFQIL